MVRLWFQVRITFILIHNQLCRLAQGCIQQFIPLLLRACCSNLRLQLGISLFKYPPVRGGGGGPCA